MTGAQNQLERVYGQLCAGNVGLTIAEMEVYLVAYPQQQTYERLNGIKAEYELMVDYWRRGVNDPQLNQLYQHLLQRLYVLYGNISIHHRLRFSPTLTSIYSRARTDSMDRSLSAIRKEMEDFVSNVVMLELEPEHTRQDKSMQLYKEHQTQMNSLFCYILTSRMWTDGVGHDLEEILISPTIDGNDQQLLLSAVTLSLLNQYDIVKFRTLLNVYRRSQEESVRQRALVGWILSIREDVRKIYPEQEELILSLLSSRQVCEELTELQMQLVYCLNAEKDTHTIQQEIMPDIIKNNNLHLNRFVIEEKEDNSLEDILHPEASEQRMEKLEATFGRMMDMQKQGSDIYFGGFSQMKRFPFFYDISNWLMPFYIQHPDIQQYTGKMAGNRFVEKMMRTGPFCNSDKYSFVIAFSQVMERIPESMRQMLERGEATMGELPEEELHTPAFMRRAYLMDLYRFFRLYPNRREFENPFDTTQNELGACNFFSLWLFKGSPLETYKDQVVRLLKRQKLDRSASVLLASYSDSHHTVQYYLWQRMYDEALQLEPHNEMAMYGKAHQLFETEAYAEALKIFDELIAMQPEKKSYLLSKSICLVSLKEYDEALKLLYQLNYEQPDNERINHALAWTLLCSRQVEQADKVYQKLIADEPVNPEDQLNYGYCCWLLGRIDEAAHHFRKYIAALNDAERERFEFDSELLAESQVSQTQVKLMYALVFS